MSLPSITEAERWQVVRDRLSVSLYWPFGAFLIKTLDTYSTYDIIKVSGGKSAMPMTQKEMVKLLTANGWIKTKGGKGSHIKLEKVGERPITVPHGELNKYTERGIRKQAGLL